MSEDSVYRVYLADLAGGVAIQDVPTESFEATERGIMLNGRTIVPWHRVIRYVRDVVQPLEEPELMTHAEVRAWLDDGSESGETLKVRADRFDPGPWTADLLVVDAVNIEAATIHLKKIHVPWGRILEYERVPLPVKDTVPSRPD
ncbi:MAG TPA: hypothetical protein VMR89_03130 [Actinomycetota bacterium]|nr:hypothetical protein [Actinomycetota bacterium]